VDVPEPEARSLGLLLSELGLAKVGFVARITLPDE
jgi:hypothetical protein